MNFESYIINNVKNYLNSVLEEEDIKKMFFKANYSQYDYMLKNCFKELRKENEEIEKCLSHNKNSIDNLRSGLNNVFVNNNVSFFVIKT